MHAVKRRLAAESECGKKEGLIPQYVNKALSETEEEEERRKDQTSRRVGEEKFVQFDPNSATVVVVSKIESDLIISDHNCV